MRMGAVWTIKKTDDGTIVSIPSPCIVEGHDALRDIDSTRRRRTMVHEGQRARTFLDDAVDHTDRRSRRIGTVVDKPVRDDHVVAIVARDVRHGQRPKRIVPANRERGVPSVEDERLRAADGHVAGEIQLPAPAPVGRIDEVGRTEMLHAGGGVGDRRPREVERDIAAR